MRIDNQAGQTTSERGVKNFFFRISLAFLLAISFLGVVFVGLTSYLTQEYTREARQLVHANLASDIVGGVSPLLLQDDLNPATARHIMHFVVAINPSVDVYLLKPDGQIFTKVAPHEELKTTQVDLVPVQQFVESYDKPFLTGTNPKNTNQLSTFSAAPVYDKERTLRGYVYVVLENDKNAVAQQNVFQSHIPRWSIQLFLLALLVALIGGLALLYYLTRHLRDYTNVVQRFQQGDYEARVSQRFMDSFPLLGQTFNLMANTIVTNFERTNRMEQLRRELLANVSHDLRTPVSVIHGYAETMQMKNGSLPSEQQHKYLDIILSNSTKLSNLIGHLFQYSKLESDQVTALKAPFKLMEVLRKTRDNCHFVALDKQIELKIVMSEPELEVFADPELIERVVQNLVDNALKFTPVGGEICLEVEARKDSVQVSVRDTGIGIPASQLPYVFDRFRRIKNGAVLNSKGTGLGLAIVKKIMDLHGSMIRVQSELDLGTTFVFDLPRHSCA